MSEPTIILTDRDKQFSEMEQEITTLRREFAEAREQYAWAKEKSHENSVVAVRLSEENTTLKERVGELEDVLNLGRNTGIRDADRLRGALEEIVSYMQPLPDKGNTICENHVLYIATEGLKEAGG